MWWFGFDCAHGGDVVPTMAELIFHGGDDAATYRDETYVRCEVEALADQLAALA